VNDFNNRWVNETLQKEDNIIFDWNPQMEPIDIRPPEFELVPVGIYNGVDLPSTMILDDSYTVYLIIRNPEYDCEVIIE
jgi:hypothetical protein